MIKRKSLFLSQLDYGNPNEFAILKLVKTMKLTGFKSKIIHMDSLQDDPKQSQLDNFRG